MLKFEAIENKVFVVKDDGRDLLCEVAKTMLVPNHAAEQIADAMNAKFQVPS